ncbi:MAG: hypothetical protein ABIB04_02825 [Patescibacteria group bacterium]
MKSKEITIVVLVCLVVAAGSFFAGYKYTGTLGKSNQNQQFNRLQGQGTVARGQGAAAGGNIARNGSAGGGFTSGEIMSKDTNSLTVKLAGGGSKIVFFSASTTVSRMADGSLDDVVQGAQVMVTGSQNQDGSVTAKTIQLRPEGAVMPPIRAPQN